MYITIGGRRTQSGLYRVTYVGDQEDVQQEVEGRGAKSPLNVTR